MFILSFKKNCSFLIFHTQFHIRFYYHGICTFFALDLLRNWENCIKLVLSGNLDIILNFQGKISYFLELSSMVWVSNFLTTWHGWEMQVSAIVSFLLGPDRANKITIFAGDVVPRKKPDPVCCFFSYNTIEVPSSLYWTSCSEDPLFSD